MSDVCYGHWHIKITLNDQSLKCYENEWSRLIRAIVKACQTSHIGSKLIMTAKPISQQSIAHLDLCMTSNSQLVKLSPKMYI